MFSIKGFEHAPQACKVTFVQARFNGLDLFLFIEDLNVVVDFCVGLLYLWVRRERGVKDVSFNNMSFGGFSQVRYHIRDVTLLDMVFKER